MLSERYAKRNTKIILNVSKVNPPLFSSGQSEIYIRPSQQVGRIQIYNIYTGKPRVGGGSTWREVSLSYLFLMRRSYKIPSPLPFSYCVLLERKATGYLQSIQSNLLVLISTSIRRSCCVFGSRTSVTGSEVITKPVVFTF